MNLSSRSALVNTVVFPLVSCWLVNLLEFLRYCSVMKSIYILMVFLVVRFLLFWFVHFYTRLRATVVGPSCGPTSYVVGVTFAVFLFSVCSVSLDILWKHVLECVAPALQRFCLVQTPTIKQPSPFFAGFDLFNFKLQYELSSCTRVAFVGSVFVSGMTCVLCIVVSISSVTAHVF